MHELAYFREHLDVFAAMAEARHITLDLETFRVMDRERRELITQTEGLKAKRNKGSDEIARLKKEEQLNKRIGQLEERIAQEDEENPNLAINLGLHAEKITLQDILAEMQTISKTIKEADERIANL